MSQRPDVPQVKVDCGMFDANRIIRLFGTMNRKGVSTPEQPHRLSKLLTVPEKIVTLSLEQLQALASKAPQDPRKRSPSGAQRSSGRPGTFNHRLKVDEWLASHGIAFTTKTLTDGRTAYCITCPFDATHTGADASVMQAPDGQLSAKCFHDSCGGRGWHDFRDAIGKPEPEHWDPPLRASQHAIQEEHDDEAMAIAGELINLAKTDGKAAIEKSLEAPGLAALARLIDIAPGMLECFYRLLREAKVKGFEITGLCRAVKNEEKRLKREAAEARRAAARAARAEASAEPEPIDADGEGGAVDDEGYPDMVLAITNYFEKEIQTDEGYTVIRIGYSIQFLRKKVLMLSKGFPRRVGNLLFATNINKPMWLEKPAQLFSWISGLLPMGTAEHTSASALDWKNGSTMVSEDRLFAYLQQTAQNYGALEVVPHHPPLPDTYYVHDDPQGGDGEMLRQLVRFFCPATPVDHDLIVAHFLSLFWGGKPGQRPSWLFTAEDENDAEKGRGVGKTTLAEMGAKLVGGAVSIGTNEDLTQMMCRLLSPEGLDKRVVLLDNIKSLKFSWAELEALITCEVISGRRLYHGEGRRPNTMTWCLTLNGATLSKDMAQRCVIVKLRRPAHDATWEDRVTAFIDEHRWEIIGDCLAALKEPVQPLARHSRWGAWEDAVLARIGDPAECQKVIMERQGDVDDDGSEADIVRQAFIAELWFRRHNPETDIVWIPSREAALIVTEATMEKRPTNKANSYLAMLHIPELRKSDRTARGWVWTGHNAQHGPECVALRSRPPPTCSG
jgi:hypothetical protein